MYYNYDEYMRDVLGYPKTNDRSPVPQDEPYQASVTYRQDYEPRADLSQCYPDVYKMLTPMIRKACDNLYDPITEDDINKMALEIYFNFEMDEKREEPEEPEENNRNIETRPNNRSISRGNNPRFDRNLEKSIQAKPMQKEMEKVEENREEEERANPSRRPNNPTLLDLIKILILNQILGRPTHPGRPPMPPRPPMRPRDEYADYGDYPYWLY